METTAVGGAVGGVSAITPVSGLGVAAKAVTHIAGAETLYTLQTSNWTVGGAQQAAIYGTFGAAFDVGGTIAVGGVSSSLANLYPSKGPQGYLPTKGFSDLMSQAARARTGAGAVNGASSAISGLGATITTTLIDRLRSRLE